MTEDRWATLSDLYGTMRQTFQEDYHRAALLTRALRNQLAKALGCDRDNVPIYDYDEVTYEYVPEDDAFKAVSMNNDYVWLVGFGITLEMGPNTFPKTTFQFPVWFHLSEDKTEVDTSFGKITLPPGDEADFTEACNAIYSGLKTSLIRRANKQINDKKFGFMDFGKG